MSAQDPGVVLVPMSHPASGGEYAATPGQVEHLKAAGWTVDNPDADYDRWPEELQRFGGQAQVRMRHPNLDQEITVPESAVPLHRSNGWQRADDAEAEQLEAKTVEELKEEARSRDLPVSGTKAELIERLQQPTTEAPPEPEDDDDQPAEPASPEEA